MKKQATSKSIKKHMQNGGVNSFNFHASSRMIPHAIRPEVQFVKLSIKQFVRPGKKVKDDHAVQISFKNKLTDTETQLLLKYFHPCDDAWRPSLIAFPHFQTFPSRTHGVLHSCRTMVLIDTMQHLQGLHFSRESESFSVAQSINEVNASKAELEVPLVYPEVSLPQNSAENNCISGCCSPKHSTIDIIGSGSKLLNFSEPGSYCVRTAQDLIVPTEAVIKQTTSQTKILPDEFFPSPETDCVPVLEDKAMNLIETNHQNTLLKRIFFNKDTVDEKLVLEIEPQFTPADEFSITETQLSPRLTNLIESGFVPDSPIDDCGYSRQRISESAKSQFILPAQVDGLQLLNSSSSGINEMINCNAGFCAGNDIFLASSEGQSSALKDNESVGIKSHAPTSPMADEIQTPLATIASSCDNEVWDSVNGEKFSSVPKPHKFKRLRKVGDMKKNENIESMAKTSISPLGNMVGTFSSTRQFKKKKRDGERRFDDNVKAFIEEEAEVSSDATISGDEDDNIKSSSDSFIDDRVNASASSTQDGTSKPDMMAIYRRSLLSQSPFGRLTSPLATRVTESETSPDKTLNIFQSTVTDDVNQSHTLHSKHVKMNCSPEVVIATIGVCPRTTDVESMNRNSTFCTSEPVPVLNLDKQFELVVAGRESISEVDSNRNVFIDDDEFYEGLDLDAVEAHAKLLLQKKVELPQIMVTQQQKNIPIDTSPSFDLGI